LLGTDVQIIFEANLMEYFDCVKASIHITLYIRYQKTVYITELEWLYQTYIRNTDRKPVISDFRAVDKNIYVGLVPLRKPIRLDSYACR
jgi:hypothetical protein